MTDAFLTIDIGTSRCKASLLDSSGKRIAAGVAAYPSISNDLGWDEQRTEDWWTAIIEAVRQCLLHVGDVEVIAVSVTGQMHGIVAVDSSGNAMRPCLTLRDRRATEQVHVLEQTYGIEHIVEVTGSRIDPSAPAAKLLWMRDHDSDVIARAVSFMAPKDFIRHLLTGAIATDPIDAAGMFLYDLRKREWHRGLVEAVGCRLDQLPQIRESASVAGALMSWPAEALGLRTGTPVVVGAGDDVEVLGAGLVSEGSAVEHLGTTGSLLICSSTPRIDPTLRLGMYPHVVRDLWLIGGSTTNAGGALDWVSRILEAGQPLPPPKLLHRIRGARRPVFLPFLSGERTPLWDSTASGALFGLDASHVKADVIEAVYEGIAFSLRQICDEAHDLGLEIDGIVVSDASSQAATWLQLRANVYGVPLRLLKGQDATATGAMLVAATAVGVYPDLVTAATLVTAERNAVYPEVDSQLRLQSLYLAYRDLYLATKDVSRHLSLAPDEAFGRRTARPEPMQMRGRVPI